MTKKVTRRRATDVRGAAGSPRKPQPDGAAQLLWERHALRSAAEFVKRYVRECCRHTEAVADCPHCNLLFLVSWAERAAVVLVEQGTSDPAVATPVDVGKADPSRKKEAEGEGRA